MALSKAGNPVYLIGKRREEMGASVYHRVIYRSGGGLVPEPDFKATRAGALSLITAVQAAWVAAAHDISEGGLATCAAEMMLGRRSTGRLGLELSLSSGLSAEVQLFSETGGFLVEVKSEFAADFEAELKKRDLAIIRLGSVIEAPRLRIDVTGERRVDLSLDEMNRAWRGTLPAIFPAGEEVSHVK
jgi:phosphoribosylformylglycinamidine synthase